MPRNIFSPKCLHQIPVFSPQSYSPSENPPARQLDSSGRRRPKPLGQHTSGGDSTSTGRTSDDKTGPDNSNDDNSYGEGIRGRNCSSNSKSCNNSSINRNSSSGSNGTVDRNSSRGSNTSINRSRCRGSNNSRSCSSSGSSSSSNSSSISGSNCSSNSNSSSASNSSSNSNSSSGNRNGNSETVSASQPTGFPVGARQGLWGYICRLIDVSASPFKTYFQLPPPLPSPPSSELLTSLPPVGRQTNRTPWKPPEMSLPQTTPSTPSDNASFNPSISKRRSRRPGPANLPPAVPPPVSSSASSEPPFEVIVCTNTTKAVKKRKSRKEGSGMDRVGSLSALARTGDGSEDKSEVSSSILEDTLNNLIKCKDDINNREKMVDTNNATERQSGADIDPVLDDSKNIPLHLQAMTTPIPIDTKTPSGGSAGASQPTSCETGTISSLCRPSALTLPVRQITAVSYPISTDVTALPAAVFCDNEEGSDGSCLGGTRGDQKHVWQTGTSDYQEKSPSISSQVQISRCQLTGHMAGNSVATKTVTTETKKESHLPYLLEPTTTTTPKLFLKHRLGWQHNRRKRSHLKYVGNLKELIGRLNTMRERLDVLLSLDKTDAAVTREVAELRFCISESEMLARKIVTDRPTASPGSDLKPPYTHTTKTPSSTSATIGSFDGSSAITGSVNGSNADIGTDDGSSANICSIKGSSANVRSIKCSSANIGSDNGSSANIGSVNGSSGNSGSDKDGSANTGSVNGSSALMDTYNGGRTSIMNAGCVNGMSHNDCISLNSGSGSGGCIKSGGNGINIGGSGITNGGIGDSMIDTFAGKGEVNENMFLTLKRSSVANNFDSIGSGSTEVSPSYAYHPQCHCYHSVEEGCGVFVVGFQEEGALQGSSVMGITEDVQVQVISNIDCLLEARAGAEGDVNEETNDNPHSLAATGLAGNGKDEDNRREGVFGVRSVERSLENATTIYRFYDPVEHAWLEVSLPTEPNHQIHVI